MCPRNAQPNSDRKFYSDLAGKTERACMTLAAAQTFIQAVVNDPELVTRINLADDIAALQGILSELEMAFSDEEFEQAYFNVLTWCRTFQQAEAVKEIKLWWNGLRYCMIHP
jgi:hypothetical protein